MPGFVLGKLLLVFVAAVALLLGATISASAVGDATRAGSASRVVDVQFTGPPAVSSRGAGSSSGCRRITGSLRGINVFRETQWSFAMRAEWCWADGRITYRYSDPTVSSPGQFWSFRGWIGNSWSHGRRSPWTRYRQASFEQCIPLPAGNELCGHEAHPWMRFTMYSGGSYRIDHS